MLRGLYGEQAWPTFDAVLQPLLALAGRFSPIIGNVAEAQRLTRADSIVLEAQLGTLRDLTFGNYPYTTSSSVLAANAELGSGLQWKTKPTVTAVVKAFSSSVGEGPFPTAMEDMSELRETAHEFGARTGRARDVGHFDAVATHYGVAMQKADEVALTKLDCLSGQPVLQICTGYELDGQRLDYYPLTDALYKVTPVYEHLPGWQEDIGEVREFADLPENAQQYVERIEALIGCPVRYVSVGPHREQLILR
jgi:adenylosuccinate synthase